MYPSNVTADRLQVRCCLSTDATAQWLFRMAIIVVLLEVLEQRKLLAANFTFEFPDRSLQVGRYKKKVKESAIISSTWRKKRFYFGFKSPKFRN